MDTPKDNRRATCVRSARVTVPARDGPFANGKPVHRTWHFSSPRWTSVTDLMTFVIAIENALRCQLSRRIDASHAKRPRCSPAASAWALTRRVAAFEPAAPTLNIYTGATLPPGPGSNSLGPLLGALQTRQPNPLHRIPKTPEL